MWHGKALWQALVETLPLLVRPPMPLQMQTWLRLPVHPTNSVQEEVVGWQNDVHQEVRKMQMPTKAWLNFCQLKMLFAVLQDEELLCAEDKMFCFPYSFATISRTPLV
eukprot:Seg2898.1 transcript_id=Seg2898.1/GoldUCD/mRNA.D3Y31 product="hypothetical protein" protein_id=Seg2898.1/GoldUCD/D3Y31